MSQTGPAAVFFSSCTLLISICSLSYAVVVCCVQWVKKGNRTSGQVCMRVQGEWMR